MTKKLILLILALPLFLMIILFTAANGVSLAVPIPVSKVEIAGDDIVYLNMDDPDEQYLLEYMVYPTNAANKRATVSYLPVEGDNGEDQPLAKFDYNAETGVLKPLAPGVAQVVVTTVDGGYSDRILVVVETRELVSIDAALPGEEAVYDEVLGLDKYSLDPGESFKIENIFTPETASNLRVSYTTSDPTVVTVNARGVIQARSAGVATITVTSRANSYISYSFAVEVKNPENQSIVIVDKDVISSKDEGQINMSITTEEEYEIIYEILDQNGDPLANAKDIIVVRVSEDGKSLEYFFADPNYYGTVKIDVTLKTTSGEETTIRCSVSKTEIQEADKIYISFDQDAYEMFLDQTVDVFFELLPTNSYKDVEITITSSNDKLAIYSLDSTYAVESLYSVILEPKFIGATDITVTVKNNETGEVSSKTVAIVVKPRSMIARIDAEKQAFGIEGSYTIGKYNADGSLFSQYLLCNVNGADQSFYDNIEWVSSNDAVSVTKDGKIVFNEGKPVKDFVTFTAKFSYGGITVSSQAVKIRCISEGYNVYNYLELVKITKEEKIVVLQNDIVDDFGEDENGNMLPTDQLYEWMDSTYDITWYKNSGRESEARVKVLIQFKNDVYGNAHMINAHNVVAIGQGKDPNDSYSTTGQPNLKDSAIFRGPLYFVAISDDVSGGAVSVAGQDNISFAAYKNVTLNNVELVSRNITPDEDGNINLQNLHYAGTTLEILGDNVTLEYSRVRNGRNVVRAFGDVDDPTTVIHFTVKNSVLREGRDFIMRLGSNCFIDGTKENTTPYLPGDDHSDKTDNIDYTVRHDYAGLTDEQKAEYDSKFIKTFVTLHNSVLQNPGIFAIGMDSHFSGSALADGDAFRQFAGDTDALKSWRDLAKTSYGVKLTLSGDVRMYCWKTLDTIDSSSLIEINGELNIGKLNPDNLEFSVAKMVRDAVKKNANLRNIIYNDGANDYVHAGIAFFGGGRNYGVLEDTNYAFQDYNAYEVSLVQVGKPELQLAAGQESFYFYIHDATTKGFLPEDQTAMLSDDKEAYSCLYKK